jgi:hypothetical protein
MRDSPIIDEIHTTRIISHVKPFYDFCHVFFAHDIFERRKSEKFEDGG